MTLPGDWNAPLQAAVADASFTQLQEFLATERAQHDVFPPAEQVFEALRLTPLADTRVLILGQDPYHDVGQAHGLCFSVQPGVKLPPSLRNIYQELQQDLGHEPATDGCLDSWARQGVLLLNTVLTVRAHQANSHRKRGWEPFTDAVIRAVSAGPNPVVFVLWGRPAQTKRRLIDDQRHCVIESPHPSPLSAHRGFFGSRPFSRINDALREFGHAEIDWALVR